MTMKALNTGDTINNVIFGILGFVLGLIVIGQSAIITLINDALTGLCNSGWTLASLFNPSGGIVPLVLMAGILGGTVFGATKVGRAIGGGK